MASEDDDCARLLKSDRIRSPLKEKLVYVSIGCSIEAQASLDQQLPAGLQRFWQSSSEFSAKLWLFDPKFWNCLPFSLRSEEAKKQPHQSAKEFLVDLSQDYHHVSTHLYERGSLRIEVCPYYFEQKASFFALFLEYLREVLLDGGHVYLCVLTQPYLKVEENVDVVTAYNQLCETLPSSTLSRLHYLHLAEYGTTSSDSQTLVWHLSNGKKHDQDEALLREVARFEGFSPTFGCGCYAAFPGALFNVSRHEYGFDYSGLHRLVLNEIEARGGAKQVLSTEEIKLNLLAFPSS